MNELEQRLAARFRGHGDWLFSRLPDWPNTTIEVGDEPTRITSERLPLELRYPSVFRQQVRVQLEGLVRVQELVGIEVLGEDVLVDAVVLADRPVDGPVLGVTGIRHWYDKLGRHHFLMMRSPKGMPLTCRWSTDGNAQKYCIAEIRRARRWWVAAFEDCGFEPGNLLWDPKTGRPEGGGVTHAVHDGGRLKAFCDGRGNGEVATVRAGDGQWLAGKSDRIRAFQREYDANEVVPVVEVPDPDDLYLEGVFG